MLSARQGGRWPGASARRWTLRLVLTHRQLRVGNSIPWGYGFAWDQPDIRNTIFIPIPFNFVAARVRSLWFLLMKGPRDRLTEEIRIELESEYGKGFSQGYHDGEEMAWAAIKRRVAMLQTAGFADNRIEIKPE